MNTITKRSIATAAVAGLVALGGAPAASADDSSQQDRQESVFGGPIELGGLSLGSAQDDSSSSSSSSTDRDEDGTETQSSSEEDSSSTDAGLEVGGTTLDPRGTFSNEGSSTSEDDGEDTTSQRDTDLAGSLGIENEGIRGFVQQDTSSAASESSSESDDDGAEADRSSSSDEESVGGGFDTGGFGVTPGGSFSDTAGSVAEDDADEGRDEQRSVLDLGAPFSYEGGTYVLDFFSATEEQEQSGEVDEDGSESEQSSETDEQSQTFGGEFEGGQGDPGLSFDSEDLEQQDD